jgi:signal transduction histidine kinase
MSLGNRITVYLLLTVLVVTGLDVYFSLNRTRANLLKDTHQELGSISHILRVMLEGVWEEIPVRYYETIARDIMNFRNILGIVFFDRHGQVVVVSSSMHDHQLPDVNVRAVIAAGTPEEGIFMEASGRRYYRVEPLTTAIGEPRGAFLLLQDLPFFTSEFRSRATQTLLNILVLFGSLALIVSVVIRRSVTQPLQAFAQRIDQIGQGDFDCGVRLSRHDEIGRLAQAFNRMCERLVTARQQQLADGEEKLRLARALHLSEKMAVIGQLASRLAHEIGTPLNIIRGRAQQLLQHAPADDKQRALLRTIISQIERLSRFIRQLLALARRPELRPRLLHVNEVVRQTWEALGERRPSGEVEILLNLTPDLPAVWGDPDQLQQVFLNICMNALQAVGQAGQITLRTRLCSSDDGQGCRGVEVVITDTGPGIAPQDLPLIFEPFFTTKSMADGTGLGLAISREIVISHHGEIRVESTPGRGSCFIVSLPPANGANRHEPSEAQL